MEQKILLQKLNKVVKDDGYTYYELSSEYATGVMDEGGGEATLADGTLLLYSGSWEGSKSGMEMDMMMSEDGSVAYVDVRDSLKEDVVVRWSFNTGQHEALTQLMLRVSMNDDLSDTMITKLYDWHLCRNLDINLNLAEALLREIDDMQCDYVGITERIQDCDDPDRFADDYSLNERYSDLAAVRLILEKAVQQLQERINESIERFGSESDDV